MNRKANNKLNLPHKSKSGTSMNSSTFIIAIIIICVTAFSLVMMPLNIQMDIAISESPIAFVKSNTCSLPKILAIIC